MAKDNLSRYTVRVEPHILRKFYYVAKDGDRSMNQLIVRLMKLEIEKYEQEHGKITQSDLEELEKKKG